MPSVTTHLDVTAPCPQWFTWAINRPCESNVVEVQGCPIHYLTWPHDDEADDARGVLFVHGGGAHANWWRFIAPFFTRDFRVAAIDISGMGDSGQRDEYSSEIRSLELSAVRDAAGLGPRPFVVGHSFGGYMTMRYAVEAGGELGGAVIVDSPIRRPADNRRVKFPPMVPQRLYPDFDTARSRFVLRPTQTCENEFIVEFIAKNSVKKIEAGWTWKFDPKVMNPRRFSEPFHEHLAKMQCRAALIYGEASALLSRDTADYMSELMGPQAPVVEIPQAQHHIMLDQPLAFVASLRLLLDGWVRAENT